MSALVLCMQRDGLTAATDIDALLLLAASTGVELPAPLAARLQRYARFTEDEWDSWLATISPKFDDVVGSHVRAALNPLFHKKSQMQRLLGR